MFFSKFPQIFENYNVGNTGINMGGGMAFAFTEKVPFLVHRKKLKSAANVDHKSPFSPQNCMRRGFDINHHAKAGEKRNEKNLYDRLEPLSAKSN